jgi:hypothetical protein
MTANITARPTDTDLVALLRDHVNGMGQTAEILEHAAIHLKRLAPTPQSRKPGIHALAVRALGVAAYIREVAPQLQAGFGADALEAANAEPFEAKVIDRAPKDITPAMLSCIVMPNGEVLCLGRSLGYVKQMGKCLRAAGGEG